MKYTSSAVLQANGVLISVRANHAGLIDRFVASGGLPFGARVIGTSAGQVHAVFHLLTRDASGGFRMRRRGHTMLDAATEEGFFEGLHAHLMVAIAEYAPDALFVHAGVVGWRGKAIVLPGVSFAGKTTLTAELVRAGATYYSDEYALIDRQGLIHPFARELQMRAPGRPEQRGVPVDELGGSAGIEPIPVGAILFIEYRAGTVWDPRAVTPAMAVMEMIRHTPAIRRIPGDAMGMLARVTQAAPAFRSLRGDAAETAALILSQFA